MNETFLIKLAYNIVGFLLFYFMSVVFHEIGHALAIYKLKKEWRPLKKKESSKFPLIYYFKCDDLTKEEYRITLASGVFLGGAVVFVSLILLFPLSALGVLIAYVWGCKGDIKYLRETFEPDEDESESSGWGL